MPRRIREAIMSDNNLTIKVSQGKGGDGGARREYFVDPKKGIYNAILVDFIDHGYSKNNYGKVVRKVQPAFQLEKTIDEKMIKEAKKAAGLPVTLDDSDKELLGKRLFVRGKKMSFSLYPGGKQAKASDLFTFLSDLQGKPLANTQEVDLNALVGTNATLMISRTPSKNDPEIVYSNIVSVSPIEDGDPVLELDDTYVRVRDRENYSPPPSLEDVESDTEPLTKGERAAADSAESEEEVAIPFGDEAAAVA